MHETEGDKQFNRRDEPGYYGTSGVDHTPVELTAELISDDSLLRAVEKLREATLANTALLMRLYDVQLALLSYTNKEQADALFDTHAEGGHFNPPIFIPVIDDKDEDGPDV